MHHVSLLLKIKEEVSMKPITTFLETAKLARKQSYKNLTLFPLLAPETADPGYLTLEQALGPIGILVHTLVVRRKLEAIFDFRHDACWQILGS